MTHSYFLLALIFLTVSACGRDTPHSSMPNPDSTPPEAGTVPQAEPELTPNSPNIVYASGWSEMIVNANSSRIAIDVAAHFTTNRNACGRETYGAIDQYNWNKLAKNLNSAIQKDPLPDQNEYCVPTPQTYPYMDGTVEVKSKENSRHLFEIKDGQICSTVSDPLVSNALLEAIQAIILAADKEDCPHGWGS